MLKPFELLDGFGLAHIPIDVLHALEHNFGDGSGPTAATHNGDAGLYVVFPSVHSETRKLGFTLNIPLSNILDTGFGCVKFVFLNDVAQLLLDFLRIGAVEICHGVVTGFLEQGHKLFGDAQCGVGRGGVARRFFLGSHLGEEQYFLYLCLAGHEHSEAVNTDTDT